MPEQALTRFLQQLPPDHGIRRLVLGFSGGLDSTVLLHALSRVAPRFGLPVFAVHVHHGLSPNADAWAQQAQTHCSDRAIPLQVHRVTVLEQASLEAAARDARRRAFAQSLQAGDALLLAQQRDDQAETLLFRLFRGAGVKGLGAMPAISVFRQEDGVAVPLWRPFLGLSRAQLLAYARQHHLSWVEDESNRDTRFARNFLRQDIIPRLQQHWPAVQEVLAATTQRLQEAETLLEEMAVELAAAAVDTQGRLDIAALQALSLPRQKLLLRHWLQQRGLPLPDEALLEKILTEVVAAREDATPLLAWSGAELRRYRQHLHAMPPLSPLPLDWCADWDGQAGLLLPDGRELRLLSGEGPFHVNYRRGGERLQLAGQAHSRELKTLLQEQGVPPWERDRLPLLWRGDVLLAVIGTTWGRADDAPLLDISPA